MAVLYFENLSGVKEDEYFRDGITEDIITELSKIKGAQDLLPADGAGLPRQIGDGPAGRAAARRRVRAGGSLRRAGERLRINDPARGRRDRFSASGPSDTTAR